MMSRLVLAVGTAALVATGCGADDDGADDTVTTEGPAEGPDAEDEGQQPAATGELADEAQGPVEAPADDESEGAVSSGGPNEAIITVGDQTFEFEWETSSIQLCDPDFFGGFVAIAATTAEADSFDAEFAEEGTPGFEDRSPRIEVSGAEMHWTADPDETSGTMHETWPAKVDSFEIDGNRVSGTATFVGNTEIGEEPVGIPGTFDITCNS